MAISLFAQAREEVSAAQGREAEAAQKRIELEKQLEVGATLFLHVFSFLIPGKRGGGVVCTERIEASC